MLLPDIFDYIDFRAFLSDWFAARKLAEPAYSYAAFARDGDCSKAALANVIRGDRSPRPTTLDAFARAMRLTPPERNYLGMLVELATAQDARSRLEAMEQLLGNERFRQLRNADHQRAADVERYLRHWWIPAIRELLTIQGFREDPDWIARTLCPPIAPEQAAEALEVLLELGFVRRQPDGSLVCQEIRFGTDPESQNIALLRYYQQEIPRLMADLDVDQSHLQHLMGATIALDPSSVPEAKAHLHQMVSKLASLGDVRPEEEPARVYQLLVMMVPVSEQVAKDGGPPAQASIG